VGRWGPEGFHVSPGRRLRLGGGCVRGESVIRWCGREPGVCGPGPYCRPAIWRVYLARLEVRIWTIFSRAGECIRIGNGQGRTGCRRCVLAPASHASRPGGRGGDARRPPRGLPDGYLAQGPGMISWWRNQKLQLLRTVIMDGSGRLVHRGGEAGLGSASRSRCKAGAGRGAGGPAGAPPRAGPGFVRRSRKDGPGGSFAGGDRSPPTPRHGQGTVRADVDRFGHLE